MYICDEARLVFPLRCLFIIQCEKVGMVDGWILMTLHPPLLLPTSIITEREALPYQVPRRSDPEPAFLSIVFCLPSATTLGYTEVSIQFRDRHILHRGVVGILDDSVLSASYDEKGPHRFCWIRKLSVKRSG